jgi:hypothetical protein
MPDITPNLRPSVAVNPSPARVSRGVLLRRTAALAGGAAALGVLGAGPALGAPPGPGPGPGPGRKGKDGDPSPIPGGIAADLQTPVTSNPYIHVLAPWVGFEMSTITDFDGVVGGAEIQGTARDNKGGSYWFDCDMRFMTGRYVDMNGHRRDGAFGFV